MIKKISTFLTTAILALGAVPSFAAEAGGGVEQTNTEYVSAYNIHRLDLKVYVSDADGITSSRLVCVNSSGKQVFSLQFQRIPMTAIYQNESNSSIVKLTNFRETPFGQYASKYNFDVRVSGIWKRSESCTPTLIIDDQRGNQSVVKSSPLRLINYLIPEREAAQPAPSVPKSPSSTTPTPIPKPIFSGLRDIFGCPVGVPNAVPEGVDLPDWFYYETCADLQNGIYKSIEFMVFKANLRMDVLDRRSLTTRLDFGDVKSVECRSSYDKHGKANQISINKKAAASVCKFVKAYDSTIKTTVTHKKSNRLTGVEVFFTPKTN